MASNELLWHPEALVEAEDARDWYALRSPLAARGFLLALNHAIEEVLAGPEVWPQDQYGCRRFVFSRRYPFTLVYRVSESVQVVAVAHQKRRPDFWRDR